MPLRSPPASSDAARAVMRANRGTDTKPEQALRSELHRRGRRFRKNLRLAIGDVRVRPDVVFTRQRLAVFVDGCFWHRCPEHGTEPRTNSAYWSEKLDRNVERDVRVTDALAEAGWRPLRIWEHVPAVDAATMVEGELDRRASSRTNTR